MPLLEINQIRHICASVRLDEATAAQVDQYAAFIQASADDVVDKALNYVFSKDRDFQEFLKTPQAKQVGTLAPEDHTLRVLVQRQDMTGAERSWANHYEVNDVIHYTRGSKAIGIGAGAYASVVAIDPAANVLTVEKANHELAIYDPRRLSGVSVYQEIDREFSVGERIQFTAPDKSLGVANRDLAVIEAIHPDGHVTAGLSDNRQIEFNAREHPHFDHGYAVTSHSSQGLTAERVLVHADTNVHPDLLNSRFAYVSVSRASHDAVLFTDDVAKLGPQLAADVSKTSALEINQASSSTQGIGLAL